MAQVSNNNFGTVRSWSSYTSSHYTRTYSPCYMIAELFMKLLTKFMELLHIIFICWLSGMSFLVTTTSGVMTLRIEKRSADMESSCEYIK